MAEAETSSPAAASGAAANGSGGAAAPFSPYEFQLAGRYLRATRKEGGVAMIAWISVISIALAVAALIIVMSVMTGFREKLLGNFFDASAHVLVDAQGLSAEEQARLSDELRDLPGAYSAGPRIAGWAVSQFGEQTSPVQIYGVRPQEAEEIPFIGGTAEVLGDVGLIFGSHEGFAEGRNGGDVVYLAYGLYRQLRANPGDEITLVLPQGARTPFGTVPRTKNYIVGGVVTTGVSTMDQFGLVMPLEQAQLFLNRPGEADTIDVRFADPSDPAPLTRMARELAPDREVSDWTSFDLALFNALQFERSLMRLVMAVLISIASMNIISGLVMLVKNKARDIAILRTMGVTQASILRIFLIVGATLGLAGSLIGIVGGSLIVINIELIQTILMIPWDPDVRFIYALPGQLDWGEVAFASIFCFVMSLIVTLPPAFRAARLDPVEALRYE